MSVDQCSGQFRPSIATFALRSVSPSHCVIGARMISHRKVAPSVARRDVRPPEARLHLVSSCESMAQDGCAIGLWHCRSAVTHNQRRNTEVSQFHDESGSAIDSSVLSMPDRLTNCVAYKLCCRPTLHSGPRCVDNTVYQQRPLDYWTPLRSVFDSALARNC
jgi:hypothetical protein